MTQLARFLTAASYPTFVLSRGRYLISTGRLELSNLFLFFFCCFESRTTGANSSKTRRAATSPGPIKKKYFLKNVNVKNSKKSHMYSHAYTRNVNVCNLKKSHIGMYDEDKFCAFMQSPRVIVQAV